MQRIEAETATGKQEFEAEAGRKLVLAIEDAGIDILHRCGGNAKSTTCRVEVLEGDAGEMRGLERNRLPLETGLAGDGRLSCPVRGRGDLTARVVNPSCTRG